MTAVTATPRPPRIKYDVNPALAVMQVGHTTQAFSEIAFTVSRSGWLRAQGRNPAGTVTWIDLIGPLPPWLAELVDDARDRLPEARRQPDDPLPALPIDRIQVGVYDRNRRYAVDKGTRYAVVVRRFDPKRDDTDSRRRAGSEALGMAIKAYEREHGPVAWDLAQVVTTHLTGKIAVELRVSP